MGFINWHGERDDKNERYEEVKEYARMVEEEEREAAYRKKLEDFARDICGTPEMLGISREDSLKIIMKEFNDIKEFYNDLIMNKSFSWDYDLHLPFNDLWFFIVMSIFYSEQTSVPKIKLDKICDVFIGKVFKLEGQINRDKYFENIDGHPNYEIYMKQSYELSQYDTIYFWKWIGFLSKTIPIENIAKDFADDFYILVLRTIYTINLFAGSFEIGIKYAQNKDSFLRNVYKQIDDNDNLNDITRHLINPIYAENRNVQKAKEYKKYRQNQMSDWKEDLKKKGECSSDSQADVNEMNNDSHDSAETKNNGINHRSYVKIILDKQLLKNYIDRRSLPGYIDAYGLLIECGLPEEMTDICRMLAEEMMILQDTIIKYQDIYQTDMEQFFDYYIPESIELISTYVDYMNARVEDKTINEAKEDVMDSSEKLLIGIVDKKNEIYKFGSMELKARSKALESMMSQDGHVSPEYKINN